MRDAPYTIELKPYGRALVELAQRHEEVVCLSGDLSRQCEIDLFQQELPDRFIHAGMAEANMMSMAGALAREGLQPFVHTFGVFATRRPYDQIVNAIAYPNLPVRIVGFMPGISTPGGPSHQALEDVALMRALPNMTVIDVSDAIEIAQVVPQLHEVAGPVYLRLKRGEIPVIFDEDHEFRVGRAYQLAIGDDVLLITSGMMLPATLHAATVLEENGVSTAVVSVPTIKPLDRTGIEAAVRASASVITVENHTIVGGLGSAIAEVIAEAGLPRRLRRLGVQDTFAEGSRTGPYLFEKYGLASRDIVAAAWKATGRVGAHPVVTSHITQPGEYAPV